MRNLLQFKKLRTSFLLTSLAQLAVLFFFVAQVVSEKYTLTGSFKKIEELSKVSIFQNTVVDALQTERGLSSSFISSKGTVYASELPAQRTTTNKEIEKLLLEYSKLDYSKYDTKIVAAIKDTEEKLKHLNGVRGSVDNFTISPENTRQEYSNIVSSLIQNVARVKELAAIDENLYDHLSTLYNLMEFKERLGRQRALYINIINDKSISESNYQSAITINTEKEYFGKQVESTHQEDLLKAYNDELYSSKNDRTREFIKFVINNRDSVVNYNPKVWFSEISECISSVHKIELLLNEKVDRLTSDLTTYNTNILLLSIGLSLIGATLLLYLVYFLSEQIVGSIEDSRQAIVNLSNGIFDDSVDNKRKDELGHLRGTIQEISRIIKNVYSQTNSVIENVNSGNLEYRAINSGFKGGWSDIVTGLNEVVGSFVKPIKVTADYVENISKGYIPEKITDDYYGDFNSIKLNLNQLIDVQLQISSFANKIANGDFTAKLVPRNQEDELIISINNVSSTIIKLIEEINTGAKQLENGELNKRMDVAGFKGTYKEVLVGINNANDTILKFVNSSSKIMVCNKDRYITFVSDPLLKMIKEHISEFRGKFASFDPDKLIGVNIDIFHQRPEYQIGILDNLKEYHSAVVGLGSKKYNFYITPVKNAEGKTLAFVKNWTDVTSQYVFKENLENLSKQLSDGDLSFRIESSNLDKDYSDLAKAINNMVDNIVRPIRVTSDYISRISRGDIPMLITDEYLGDYNTIKNNLNTLIITIQSLIDELNTMADKHNLGDIDYHANADKFEGAFNSLIVATNNLVDGHVTMTRRAMSVYEEFGLGNFNADMELLPGKKRFINDTINAVRENLVNINIEMSNIIEAAQNGELSFRVNSTTFKGDWAAMVESLNQLLDSVINPINDAGDALTSLAQGDLTVKMYGNYGGDFEKLKNNINYVVESLDKVLRNVDESVDATGTTTNQLAETSELMAAAAQEQSAQIDDVASVVEEMSRTITENARNANQTARVAEENGQIAKEGGKAVIETVGKMKDIAKVVQNTSVSIEKLGVSSKQIGEIISVIDDIADQTNLLALNAAIEAARAGEQGRGFAVVADEVRKLAERTSDATKEIASMIKGIQLETQDAVLVMKSGTKEVEDGIKLADEAGKALKLIVDSSQELINMIIQISVASEEQSTTSEEISKNVVAISTVISESARQIGEIAESTENLNRQTNLLAELMSQFKLSDQVTYQKSGLNSMSRKLLS